MFYNQLKYVVKSVVYHDDDSWLKTSDDLIVS